MDNNEDKKPEMPTIYIVFTALTIILVFGLLLTFVYSLRAAGFTPIIPIQ